MAKQSGKNPDNLVKYMADINASLANVMTAIDDLKERVTQGFAEQDQLRKDNLRSVTARVASIGHEVSYLREAVCSNVTDTRHDVQNAIEDRYRKTREALRKATKTEISVMRDLFLKTNPNIFTGEDGRIVVAANPPAGGSGQSEKEGKPEEAESPANVPASIPPSWAMEVEPPTGDEYSDDDMKAALINKLPFDDDIDIWDLLNVPGAQVAIMEYTDVHLPDDVTKSTDNSKYADYIVWSLLTDSYTEDHVIPAAKEEESAEYSPNALPPVPKHVLALLQNLAVRNRSVNFDVNTFWHYVREHFPEFCPTGNVGPKPTATSLVLQAQAAVSEEEQAAKAARSSTKAGYEKLLHLMREYRSSSDESPEPPGGQLDVTHEPGELTMNLGEGLNTTIGAQIRMELRSSKVETAVSTSTSEEKSLKRTTKEDKVAAVDVKKPRRN